MITSVLLRSLKDILYKKRMERQLAAARGLGPMGERPPDEDGSSMGVGGIPTAGSKVRPSRTVSFINQRCDRLTARPATYDRCRQDHAATDHADARLLSCGQGGYVPPSVRNRGAAGMGDSMHRREENSVRVTNLSEDTREEDLRVSTQLVALPWVISVDKGHEEGYECRCLGYAMLREVAMGEFNDCNEMSIKSATAMHAVTVLHACVGIAY